MISKTPLRGVVFQESSSDPATLLSSEVRREYIRVQQIFRQEDAAWDFGAISRPEGRYFNTHFLSDVPPHAGGEDPSVFLSEEDRLTRVLEITCVAQNKGTQKVAGGRRARRVGPCPSPKDSLDIADRTSNMGIDAMAKIAVAFSKTPGEWCQYTSAISGADKGVRASRTSATRGAEHTTMGAMTGPVRAKDTEGNLFHWKLELRTSDWLKLAREFGSRFTARELYSYCCSLPILIAGKRPGKHKMKNAKMFADFVDVQINSKDWAVNEGLAEPTCRGDYMVIIRKMGHKTCDLEVHEETELDGPHSRLRRRGGLRQVV
jgi:hypothetical protein